MLARACEEAASWESKGLGSITVSVNLSPFQFSNPDLVSSVRRALEVSGLDPGRLELEITETGLASIAEGAQDRLAELRALGVGLSIDDFGTGSSSISRLRDYPVNAVKVPKEFVDPLPGNPKATMIARAVIDLAHNLDFQVIAEGVEDREQFDWLRAASCDQYQGHLFAPALSAADFAAALAKSLVEG
jgi:EAL domain-containing protein (putative c-di-GMP-specific phosphodiesterase class I)